MGAIADEVIKGGSEMIDKERFYTTISQGNIHEVEKLTQGTLDAGESPESIMEEGLIQAMGRIGDKFKNGEIYIPEVLIAARAMHAGMAIIQPALSQTSGTVVGKVVIGTVKGDFHDIGKNMVIMMLEGAGFKVVDLGIDVPAEKFVEAIQRHQPHLVGMSCLLTTTMREMKNTIQSIEEAGLGNQVKTIVGGATVTEGFAKEIGADGTAQDAASAVDLAKSLLVS